MTRLSGAVLIGLLACALSITACGGSESAEGEAEMVEAAPRAPDAAAVAAADRLCVEARQRRQARPDRPGAGRDRLRAPGRGGSETSSSRRSG